MTSAELIRNRIEQIPEGEPFTSSTFLELGTRATVDQTLSRLVRAGALTRVTRGVFVRPKENRFVGHVMPEPFKVAEAIAKASGATIQIHGAEAACQFELTTQVPTQPVFYTTGPTKSFRLGRLEVLLKHSSASKLALTGPAGLALAALRYLGKGQVTTSTIEMIRKKLSPAEFKTLKHEPKPSWMADVFYHSEHVNHAP